jgi:Zn-dependent protease
LSETNLALPFLSFMVLLFSLTVHEAAHAWTADRLGDPTARTLGRVSLNPLVHIDPIGTVLLPLVALVTGAPLIGWAKPVPVNTRQLRSMRRDFMVIAAAGPASNLLLAVASSFVLRAIPDRSLDLGTLNVSDPLIVLVVLAFRLNLLLMLFNLVPVPPLDGGNILGGLLRGTISQRFDALRPWGVFILYALMLSGTLGTIIGPPYLFLERLLTL